MNELPVDILIEILLYLDEKDIDTLVLVYPVLRESTNHKHLWLRVLTMKNLDKYIPFLDPSIQKFNNYIEVYQYILELDTIFRNRFKNKYNYQLIVNQLSIEQYFDTITMNVCCYYGIDKNTIMNICKSKDGTNEDEYIVKDIFYPGTSYSFPKSKIDNFLTKFLLDSNRFGKYNKSKK